jgi:protein-disulfide isomerase
VLVSIAKTVRYSLNYLLKVIVGERREALLVGSLIIWGTLCALSPKGVHWLILKVRDPFAEHSYDYKVAEQLAKWRNVQQVSLPINVDGSMFGDFAIGEPDAPIQIVEFADFECPGCRALYAGMRDILDKFKGRYRLVFKNYPLDKGCNPRMKFVLHVNACLAASFIRCAGEQGRFWQGVDFAFTTTLLEGRTRQRPGQRVESQANPLAPESFLSAASSELGLDLIGLSECVDSWRYRDVILREVSEGDSLGLTSTPSIWVNGKMVERPNPQLLEAIFNDITKR